MTLLQVRMRMKEHVTLYFDLGFIQCKYLHFWLLLFTVRVNLFSLHTDIKFTSRPTRNITFTCMVSSSRSVLPSLVTLQQILFRKLATQRAKFVLNHVLTIPCKITLVSGILLCKLTEISSGSRNFKTGGRGPGALEFLGLGFVMMPLHTYPMCL